MKQVADDLRLTRFDGDLGHGALQRTQAKTITKAKTQSPAATALVAPMLPAAVSSIKRYNETFRKNAVEHWIQTGQPGTPDRRPTGRQLPNSVWGAQPPSAREIY